ncbi:hypothetical protein CBL_12540 [Carabus blaptoides fortunei]
MFHCYHRKDDRSLSLSEGGNTGSVMSRIRTRSNYSAVLTMGLPHALEFGALTLFGKRTRSAEEVRHLFRYQSMDARISNDYEMETLSIKEPTTQKTRSHHRDRAMSSFALRSISIDVPFLYPKVEDGEDDRNMLVSYSYRNNVISIALPSTNVSGDCSKTSLSSGDVSLRQTDVHVPQNELADLSMGESIISEGTANRELSQLVNGIRTEEQSAMESDGASGLVESQIVELDSYSSPDNATSPYHHHQHSDSFTDKTYSDQTCNSACMIFFLSCGCCCGKKRKAVLNLNP